ncbi:hypothetical protein K466DRAFT_384601 [Polyporus arcularius HHB13444]|uniref:Uncharacterized protein n=1 Tax=Polyporus arcularius HHB13444 TaxID=1314778 RepID=A0A5C3PL35_9APHY|nr:hypothetical protein K466DRAFT_384601 [Polyporus arcularius HHB13444]
MHAPLPPEDHDGFEFRVKIVPNSTDTTIKPFTRTICQRPISLKMLSIRACEVYALMPLYYLLDSIAHIDTFTLRSLYMLGFHKLPTGTLNVRISTIHVDGAFAIGVHCWKELRRSLTPGAVQGLRVSTRLVVRSELRNRDPSESLLEFLAAFGPDVVSVTVNVLGASCHDFNRIVGGEVHPSLKASTYLQPGRPLGVADTAAVFNIMALASTEFPEFPRIDLSSSVSLREMVLYLTTTSVKTGPSATRLYARLLENNCSLLSTAPTSLTHIELRFQRYGPHIRAMIDDLRAIDDPTANPGPVRWSTVDEGMFARFPDLEAFTCVLCDGGFVEQHGPLALERAEPVAPDSGVGRQQEFDEYVELLKEVLPRLHGRDLLRFRMSEV